MVLIILIIVVICLFGIGNNKSIDKNTKDKGITIEEMIFIDEMDDD